uniref:Calx-beta domain-containing protein n=1 Tax=Panagrolaimus sp. JU765 TaxID=591449 RepID=A0AC34R749_9BILA
MILFSDYLLQEETDPEVIAFEEHKRLFWKIFQETRLEHPDLNIKEIGKLTAWKALAEAPKSRAVRRIQAVRSLVAGVPLMKEVDQKAEDIIKPLVPAKEAKVIVQFQPCHYICMENVGKINLHVNVDRGSIEESCLVTVQYKTIQDTATEGKDYEGVQGSITFQPKENVATIPIKIIDCEKYEEDEKFHVQLYNARAISSSDPSVELPSTIGPASTATVIIVDDDHAGAFGFSSEVFKVSENVSTFFLKVERTRGARGA